MEHASLLPNAAKPLLRYDAPVVLIGGGVVSDAALRQARALAVALIAADGAANRFAAQKAALDAVIGDLDSLDDPEGWAAALGARLVRLQEQETTDFEKCLYSVAAPLYFGVGFQGGRVDHALAAAQLLLKRADQRLVLLEEEDAVFLAPRRWRIELPPGARVSLIPLRRVRGLGSTGLRWPLRGLTFEPGAATGASNQATGGPVETEFDGEGPWAPVLAVVERRHLGAALASIGAPQAEPRP